MRCINEMIIEEKKGSRAQGHCQNQMNLGSRMSIELSTAEVR